METWLLSMWTNINSNLHVHKIHRKYLNWINWWWLQYIWIESMWPYLQQKLFLRRATALHSVRFSGIAQLRAWHHSSIFIWLGSQGSHLFIVRRSLPTNPCVKLKINPKINPSRHHQCKISWRPSFQSNRTFRWKHEIWNETLYVAYHISAWTCGGCHICICNY